jgi:hypothetical protein
VTEPNAQKNRLAANTAFIIACSNQQLVGVVLALHGHAAIGAALVVTAGAALYGAAHRDHVRSNR